MYSFVHSALVPACSAHFIAHFVPCGLSSLLYWKILAEITKRLHLKIPVHIRLSFYYSIEFNCIFSHIGLMT